MGTEAASTRDAIVPLISRVLSMQRIVSAPVGVSVRLFRFSTNSVVSFTRNGPGPSLDDNVYYGLSFAATIGTTVLIRFDPFRDDTYVNAGPLYNELVYFTIGTNPSALATILPD